MQDYQKIIKAGYGLNANEARHMNQLWQEALTKMKVDFSKIPSVCTVALSNRTGTGWYCFLEEKIRGRKITAQGTGDTPQDAVDNAVKAFST